MIVNEFIDKIKSNNVFFKNFTYLSIVEIINIVVPFITLPYLIITLGKENYGLVVFAHAITSYFVVIQNFGLNTYAVKEVSINSKDIDKLSTIICSVTIIKAILFLLILLILFVLTLISPLIRENWLLFLLSLWVCLFDIFFPRWYFQGTEKMKYISIVFFLSKITSLVLIFLLIKSPDDFLKVPMIYLLGSILPSVLSLLVIFKKDKLTLRIDSFLSLKNTFRKTSTFFISDVSVVLFANSNKVIIGSIIGMVELSYYDLADKIIMAFKSVPLNIVRDSIYPRVARTKNMNIVRKTTIIMTTYAILVTIFLFLFGNFIVNLLGGTEMLISVIILKILSISILTTHISNYYITVGLWSLEYEKTFRNLMINSSLLFLFLAMLLWFFDVLNIYTITILPILVDIYLIIHTYYIYRIEKISL